MLTVQIQDSIFWENSAGADGGKSSSLIPDLPPNFPMPPSLSLTTHPPSPPGAIYRRQGVLKSEANIYFGG